MRDTLAFDQSCINQNASNREDFKQLVRLSLWLWECSDNTVQTKEMEMTHTLPS